VRRATVIFVNGAAALSLLVCGVTLALWVRSAWAGALVVSWGEPHGAVGRALVVSRGAISLRSAWSVRPMSLNEKTRAIEVTLARVDAPGFARIRTSWVPQTIAGAPLPGNFGTFQETRIALAWPLLLSAVASAWLVARAWKLRRPIPGLCRRCGYDLRATPDRCPECGTSADR
jgi:hypothetical protein